jgi:putative DNA primase/helicase
MSIGAALICGTRHEKLAAAAAMTPAQYDLVRNDLAASLDLRVGTLDKEVALIRRAPNAPSPPPAALPAELQDTDIANARRFALRHGDNVKFTPERGWFAWDGRRWAADDKCLDVQERGKETAVSIFDEIRFAQDRDARMRHAKHSQSKTSIDAMINLARSEPGIPARLTDFDKDGWLLNVANGTIDLRTGQLRPHDRKNLISNLVDVTFDPAAQCELWDAFLRRVLDHDEELYAYLRRFVGYLLIGDNSEQSLHFLFGLGANGKSVFCEILMALLGDYAMAASPDMIMLRKHGGIPNDIARLRGVRVALMNETSQGARFDEAKLKDLTGGDTLTARFLHQEFFDFKPTHRIVIRGNHKPTINGTDEGIWRRLRLVPFGVQIPPDEQDRDLLRKLHAELPGILNWALQGCREWQTVGLKPPAIVTAAVAEYRAESDTLGRFISECCEPRPNAQVKSGVLFKRYQEFCEQAGERWLASKDFPNEMQRRGFTWKRMTAASVYLGVELRASDEQNWGNR